MSCAGEELRPNAAVWLYGCVAVYDVMAFVAHVSPKDFRRVAVNPYLTLLTSPYN